MALKDLAKKLVDAGKKKLSKIDGEKLGKKIGDKINEKATKEIKKRFGNKSPKEIGDELGKKAADKIGRALGLGGDKPKKGPSVKYTPGGKKVGGSKDKEAANYTTKAGRAAHALHNAAVRLAKTKEGKPLNLTDEERENRAIRMRYAQTYRWG